MPEEPPLTWQAGIRSSQLLVYELRLFQSAQLHGPPAWLTVSNQTRSGRLFSSSCHTSAVALSRELKWQVLVELARQVRGRKGQGVDCSTHASDEGGRETDPTNKTAESEELPELSEIVSVSHYGDIKLHELLSVSGWSPSAEVPRV